MSYSDDCQKRFGLKVYKIPIHLLGSCPNRDGTKGNGGCIFCGEEGGSFDWIQGSIKEQFNRNKAYIQKRYSAEGFIAYFQNFTGTYFPLDVYRKHLEAIAKEDILGVSISTRPDCIDASYLDVTKELFADKEVTFELGLQSANEKSLKILNRGHTLEDFIQGAKAVKEYGFRLSVHMILDLPWDLEEDVVNGAKLLNATAADEVKVHNLYVPKGTKLAEMYQSGEYIPIPMEVFIRRVIIFLEHLRPDMVIGRLLGRAPEKEVLFSNWNRSWYYIRDEIIKKMKENNKWQGRLYREKGR